MGCTCCDNVLDLGCIAYCEPLLLPVIAAVDGVYAIKTDFLGRELNYNQSQTAGSNILFSPRWNENYRYNLELYDPNGARLIYTDIDAIEYDCFSFQTRFSYSETIVVPAP